MKFARGGITLGVVAALVACAAPGIHAESLPLTAVKPAPTKQEIEAQLLAIEATGSLVAAPDLAARVAEELGAIRLNFPKVEGVRARPRWEPTSLLVAFVPDPQVRAKVLARTYGAWDAANRTYEVREIDTRMLQSGDLGIVILRFSQAINAPKVAGEYSALPGVTYAEPDGSAGDGPDICLAMRGTAHYYVFDQAAGDCPAGCLEHEYTAFKVEPNQAPLAVPDVKKSDYPECSKWL